MAKRPWRAHFTRDWRIDPFTRSLDLEARMVYFELLDIAWDEGGLHAHWLERGIYVAQQIGITRRKFAAIWPSIRDKFEEISPGIWSNSKLENERTKADESSENQANRVKKRWERDTAVIQRGKAPVIPLTVTVTTQSQSQSQEEKEIAAKAPPLPFKPNEAVSALSTASKGRFIASKLSKGQAINTQRLIRESPALSTWTLVGEWLAAGGDSWKGPLDIRNLGDFTTWKAHAEKWEADGKGDVGKKTRVNGVNRAEPAPHNAESEDWTDRV